MDTEHPLKRLRLHLRLNQQTFADGLGLHQSAVSEWESGKRRMRNETALKIAQTHEQAMREVGITAGDLILGIAA